MFKKSFLVLSIATTCTLTSCVNSGNIPTKNNLNLFESDLHKRLNIIVNSESLAQRFHINEWNNKSTAHVFLYSEILDYLGYLFKRNEISISKYTTLASYVKNFTLSINNPAYQIPYDLRSEVYGYLLYLHQYLKFQYFNTLSYTNLANIASTFSEDNNSAQAGFNNINLHLDTQINEIYSESLKINDNSKLQQHWQELSRLLLDEMDNKNFGIKDYIDYYDYENPYIRGTEPTERSADKHSTKKKIKYLKKRISLFDSTHMFTYKDLAHNRSQLTILNARVRFKNTDTDKNLLIFDIPTHINLNDVSIATNQFKQDQINSDFIVFNVKYQPKLMDFEQYLDFVSKHKYSKNDTSNLKFKTVSIDLRELGINADVLVNNLSRNLIVDIRVSPSIFHTNFYTTNDNDYYWYGDLYSKAILEHRKNNVKNILVSTPTDREINTFNSMQWNKYRKHLISRYLDDKIFTVGDKIYYWKDWENIEMFG
ncbi:hypothetical protein [Mycoplasma simbae]|uniref:hypothetical protein n=1 Tax=Mycoplasma simbae TaxID=36744 RepID=UPI0004951529|nr:hypothetical protein [Mycoplasma simbae]